MNEHQPPEGNPEPPKFDPNAAHMQRPKLRAVRGFPAKMGDQTVLGLADARQVSSKMVFTAPAAQMILPHLTGEKSLSEVLQVVGKGLTQETLEQLVAQLDDAGLLEGPTYQAIWEQVKADFDSADLLPPATTAAFADSLVGPQPDTGELDEDERARLGAAKMTEIFDTWIDKALENVEKPSFDSLPKAVVAPHIDYGRGWMNYAAVWGRLRVVDRPDRVVILGTNHFGHGTGVVGCEKGFETPLGSCEVDTELVSLLRSKLGDGLFEHQYDHEREHSIELQVPWIQHCLGRDESGAHCRIFGALVHDPAVNNGESYDGTGIAIQAFVDALKESIDSLDGTTLVVSSADLSHVGPAFGDKRSLVGDEPEVKAIRDKTFSHDRELLEMVRQNKPTDLVSSMAWQQNPTRWCSTGNLVATLMTVEPDDVQLLNYAAAMDSQGMSLVSTSAMAMF